MKKRLVAFLVMWAVILVVGAGVWYFLKKRGPNPENQVLNVIVHEKDGSLTTLDGKKITASRGLDGIYAKDELSFYNKVKALQRSAPEVIQELNQIGLTREEMITSIASLLNLVEDEMRAKNITTDYIASLGFQLTGAEYVTLLQASKIKDDFYYSNVIKNTLAYVEFPLTQPQEEAVLAPLESGDYRSRCKTLLDREKSRQSGGSE